MRGYIYVPRRNCLNMHIIIIISFIILYTFFLPFQVFVNQPITVIKYAIMDMWFYKIRYHNIPHDSFIRVYVGLFGHGKTLSAVHDVVEFYKEYNDKIVYDDRQKRYVRQRVFIISNVNLKGVPYRKFRSMQQLCNIAKWRHVDDKAKGYRTITVVLGDEFSVQMNSRAFRNNFSGTSLNALLCSRHALIDRFYLTAQRFQQMDALLRQVSTEVVECRKTWRYQRNTYFDAYEYDNYNRDTIKATKNKAWFVRNKDYNLYDTHQIVDNLVKEVEEGNLMSPEEETNLKYLHQKTDKPQKLKKIRK